MRFRWHKWWYGTATPPLTLRILAMLFRIVVGTRRWFYRCGLLAVGHPGVPVIVVGNITVGGCGKTPMVLWLCQRLQAHGYRPGIVSRGYRSQAGRGPVMVGADSTATAVGDEPILLYRRTHLPIAVGSDRLGCARYLRAAHGVDVIVSDDGLQHFRLNRDLEIALVDGQRRFGNGRLLPAGPLRELPNRLATADAVVWKGSGPGTVMSLVGEVALALDQSGRRKPLGDFVGCRVHAIAGIGNPEDFFQSIKRVGVDIEPHEFPDHHVFVAADFAAWQDQTVIMTEKDALKCARFCGPDWWYVPVNAVLPGAFEQWLGQQMQLLKHRR